MALNPVSASLLWCIFMAIGLILMGSVSSLTVKDQADPVKNRRDQDRTGNNQHDDPPEAFDSQSELELALKSKPCPNEFSQAIRSHVVEKVEELLKGDAGLKDCTTTIKLRRNIKVDGTALHLAAMSGFGDLLDVMLANGFDPDARTRSTNTTALMLAAQMGHLKAVETLSQASEMGCDLQDEEGMTALMWAAKDDRLDVIYALLKTSRSGIDIQNKEEMSALMLAAMEGKYRVINALSDFDPNPNLTQEDGDMGLILAARWGRWRGVRQLLANYSIDVNAQNAEKQTALMIVVERDFDKVVKLLKEAPGIARDLRNKDGVNALVLAAEISRKSATSFLAIKEKFNESAFQEVVYLLDRGIKKLRSVQAQVDPELFAGQTVLWRGMKNLEVDIGQFAAVGGTEMAPMSTTTKEEVARHYATSKVPLVFKYVVGGLKTGVSIQFLSLYPKEEEFLYAPLTSCP